MVRLVPLLICLLCADCTVLTSILSTDLGDAGEESAALDASEESADASGDTGDSNGIQCPPNYETVGDTCHRTVTGADLSWFDAEDDCEQDGDGSHLVIVDSAEEGAALPENAWIGIYEFDVQGNFRTVTNQDLPYTRWEAGEPSVGGALCGEYRSAGWHDVNCGELHPYVCEFDGVVADTSFL